jgi:ribosomal protein S14
LRKQHHKPLRSRKRLRPISDKQKALRGAQGDAEKALAHAWWEAVAKNKPCAVCGRPDRVQGHHVLSQQVLRRHARRFGYDALALLWDPRNGIPVCERDHSAHTGAMKRIPLAVIPAPALDFADEIGLRWQVERDYPAS